MAKTRPVVVTGAAGFIGSHVCERLLSRGISVVGIDNFDPYYRTDLKRANVASIEKAARERGAGGPSGSGPAGFTLEEMDICDAPAVRALFERERPMGVVHLAAKAGVRPSIADPVGYMHANVTGTQAVLSAATAAGCERAVLASSSSVYGNLATVPFAETADVSAPISPYAASKRACELLAHSHHHLTGLPTALLRFFTVFGPRQRPDLAIGLFLGKVSRGETIPVFGDGRSSRDYTYVDDIVSGVVNALDRVDAFGYRIWNLGGNHPVTLTEMVASIGRTVGREPRIERRPMQQGDVERTFADLSRSGSEIGYAPQTTFEEGLRRQWASMQSQG
ncbi:MAG: NAD-dependent epimerase/dehydratase family protein [Phycisphaerales bacterium]